MNKIIVIVVSLLIVSCKKEVINRETTKEKKESIIERKEKTNKLVNEVNKKQELPKRETVFKEDIVNHKPEKGYANMSFYNGKLNLNLPNEFKLMSSDIVKLKYPQINPDEAKVYSNANGEVSLLLELLNKPFKEADFENVIANFDKTFKRPEIQYGGANIVNINNKNFVVTEAAYAALDAKIYNMIFTTNIGGKKFTGSFNCTQRYYDEWHSKGQKILNSIVVK